MSTANLVASPKFELTPPHDSNENRVEFIPRALPERNKRRERGREREQPSSGSKNR